VLAPMSLIALVLAPIAGKMSDKIGGKYILMSGLALFGLGAGILVLQSAPDSNWPEFIPAIAIMGLGMGGIWAPMATEAMRGVPPMLAGAASGVNNTIRQVGSVVGSAAVGALLQARLSTTLHEEAVSRSAQLPADARTALLAGFAKSAHGGVDVGVHQATTPSGLPADLVTRLQQIAADVFQHGYVRAMHPTLVLPVAAMFAGSLLCLLTDRHTTGRAARAAAPVPEPAVTSEALAQSPALRALED
jgi:MFS transporter